MVFLIATHVPHLHHKGLLYAYHPYVNEMNLWTAKMSKVIVIAPASTEELDPIQSHYQHENICWIKVPNISLCSFADLLQCLYKVPYIFGVLFYQMSKANHLHLRCPGNIGFLALLAQFFFPKKKKTVKYAGNWDLNCKQPRSYRWQQLLLRKSWIGKNIKVLVYGEWEQQKAPVISFFTASYASSILEKEIAPRTTSPLKFIFVGTLSANKNPMYALRLFQILKAQIPTAEIHFYGEGKEKENGIIFCEQEQILDVYWHGNKNSSTIINAYQTSHFLILPSQSEGWPKVVAEAQFWGCIPLVTSVSCVSNMLDNGKRGYLLSTHLQQDANAILQLISETKKRQHMQEEGIKWSRHYTKETFQGAIDNLLFSL